MKTVTIDLSWLSDLYTKEFEKIEREQNKFMNNLYNKFLKK